MPSTTLPIFLYLQDPQGRVVRGQTTLIPQVFIDKISSTKNEKNDYSLSLDFKDRVEENFYRCIINKDSVNV